MRWPKLLAPVVGMLLLLACSPEEATPASTSAPTTTVAPTSTTSTPTAAPVTTTHEPPPTTTEPPDVTSSIEPPISNLPEIHVDPLEPSLEAQLGPDPDGWGLHDPSRLVDVDGLLMLAATGREQADGYDCGLETWFAPVEGYSFLPGQCLLREKPEWIADLLPGNDGAYWAPGVLDDRALYYSVPAGAFDDAEEVEGINGGCMGLLRATGSAPNLV